MTRERARSFLPGDHIRRIVGAHRASEDIPGLARVAPTDEVPEKDGDPSIPLYARAESGRANGSGDGATLQQSIAEWQMSSATLRGSMSDLSKTLGVGEQHDLYDGPRPDAEWGRWERTARLECVGKEEPTCSTTSLSTSSPTP